MKPNPPPAEGRYKLGQEVLFKNIVCRVTKSYPNLEAYNIQYHDGHDVAYLGALESELSPAPQPPVAEENSPVERVSPPNTSYREKSLVNSNLQEGWEEELKNHFPYAVKGKKMCYTPGEMSHFISTHKALWEKARDERALLSVSRLRYWQDHGEYHKGYEQAITDAITAIRGDEEGEK